MYDDEEVEREYKCRICGNVFSEYDHGYYDPYEDKCYCSAECLCKAFDLEPIAKHADDERRYDVL